MKTYILVLSIIACVALVNSKSLSFDDIDIDQATRIVNGQNSTRGQFPYQALLFLNLGGERQGTCGGVLITQNHVLTAAHCVLGVNSFEVHLGALVTRNFSEPGRVIRRTETAVVHPYYVPQITWNDIAIVSWEEPVNFTATINRVVLPVSSPDFHGISAIASGFGLQNTSAPAIAPVLQWTQLNTIDNFECYQFFGPLVARLSVICARGDERRSACNGDSGGPLVTDDENRVLIGLTSFGSDEGCHHGIPVVFTRVTYFMSWIRSIVNIDLPEIDQI